MSEIKLTKPQRELLEELAEKPSRVFAGYVPLRHLLILGFVKARHRYSNTVYELTDAGRAALNPTP